MRRFANVVGIVATIAACIFVGYSLIRDGSLTTHLWSEPYYWLTVSSLSILYTALLFLIAWGWLIQVNAASERRLPTLKGLQIYAVSQIYKYLPSNLLHYLGRHAMLRQYGIGHGAAVWGTAAETALIVVGAASVASAFGFATFQGLIPESIGGHHLVYGLLAAALLFGLVFYSFRDRIANFVKPEFAPAILKTLPLYFLFFVASGWAFWLLANQMDGVPFSKVEDYIVVASSAWVLGYVTPGASAGIGIREALIIAGLTLVGHPSDAALVAVSYRLVTTIGDGLFSALGWSASALKSNE